jgi:DNA-binding GntR family transcriptional regulator
LESLHGQPKRGPSVIARELELGLLIHEVIAEATDNEALQRVTSDVYQQLRLALWLEVAWINVGAMALAEHKAIVEAIVRRDAEAARTAAARHVRSSIENMAEVETIFAGRLSRPMER